MANLRDALEDTAQHESVEKAPEMVEQMVEDKKDIMLTADEVKFLLAKIAHIDFKGVEIEFVYNLIMKLQEIYKHLSNDK